MKPVFSLFSTAEKTNPRLNSDGDSVFKTDTGITKTPDCYLFLFERLVAAQEAYKQTECKDTCAENK